MAILIDGKKTAAEIRAELRLKTDDFFEKYGRRPGLAVVRVGEDPASVVYVRNQMRACDDVGFVSKTVVLPEDSAEEEVEAEVLRLNADPMFDGLLVQLPLPRGLDEKRIVSLIDPDKDVDAFHSLDAGRLKLTDNNILPCTPAGIIELLKRYRVPMRGAEAVVVGRSDIVGRPAAALLLAADATVTVAHSRTRDLASVTRRADILVCAVGKAGLITGDMIKPGAAVIDVGMNRNIEGKLCGDVDFASAEPVAGFITPVPGGVGPMTVCMLMKNTLSAALRREEN
jgi:methylenetetrahydrofolate dehydrogenase (NADP+)/methenyltetrahydrofolate cyclohydrolase